jgi:WD40 repeat protein
MQAKEVDPACTYILGISHQEWEKNRRARPGIWDINRGTRILRLATDEWEDAESGWFIADTRLVAILVKDVVTGKPSLRVWDVHSGRHHFRVSGTPGGVSDSGAQVMLAVGGVTSVVDLSGGILLSTLEDRHSTAARATFDPLGRFLIAQKPNEPKRLTLWDNSTGQKLSTFEVGYEVKGFPIHPKGTHFVTDGRSQIDVWDLSVETGSGQEIVWWAKKHLPAGAEGVEHGLVRPAPSMRQHAWTNLEFRSPQLKKVLGHLH